MKLVVLDIKLSVIFIKNNQNPLSSTVARTLYLNSMFEEVQDCLRVMKEKFNKPLRLTRKQEQAFQKATHCHICDRKYNPEGTENVPVSDHCHIAGIYRAIDHSPKWRPKI